jgi:hypothetical protein
MPSLSPDIGAAAAPVQPARRPAARRGALALLLALAVAAPAGGADPLATARAFAQADGRGARLGPRGWSGIAPLIGWGLEPAWDHVRLISGYQLGDARGRDGAFEVEIQYSVVADVDADGVRRGARIETRTLTLEPAGGGAWRLRAPPPPPFVFESEADADTLTQLFAPTDDAYLSNSAFIWTLLRDAGWELPYSDTESLPTAAGLRAVRSANIGDLALYYDRGTPYHVAMVASDDEVVSATLNGGLRRTPFGAFAGEIRYRRPVAFPWPTPTAAATPAPPPEADDLGFPRR